MLGVAVVTLFSHKKCRICFSNLQRSWEDRRRLCSTHAPPSQLCCLSILAAPITLSCTITSGGIWLWVKIRLGACKWAQRLNFCNGWWRSSWWTQRCLSSLTTHHPQGLAQLLRHWALEPFECPEAPETSRGAASYSPGPAYDGTSQTVLDTQEAEVSPQFWVPQATGQDPSCSAMSIWVFCRHNTPCCICHPHTNASNIAWEGARHPSLGNWIKHIYFSYLIFLPAKSFAGAKLCSLLI